MLICQTGNRANQALQHLRAAGVDTARVLDGGVVAMESQHSQHTPRSAALGHGPAGAHGRRVLGAHRLRGREADLPKVGYLAGAIGAYLTFSALTDSCAMAAALNRMPWNKVEADPTVEKLLAEIPQSLQVKVPQQSAQR